MNLPLRPEVEAAFAAALELTGAEQEPFLAREYSRNPELRAEVESLLRAYLDEMPLSERARAQLFEMYWSDRDVLAGHTPAQRRAILEHTSYRDFLRRYWDADDDVLKFLHRSRWLHLRSSRPSNQHLRSRVEWLDPGPGHIEIDTPHNSEMRCGMHESRAAAELFFGFVRIVEEWDHVLGWCDVVVGDVCEAREGPRHARGAQLRRRRRARRRSG